MSLPSIMTIWQIGTLEPGLVPHVKVPEIKRKRLDFNFVVCFSFFFKCALHSSNLWWRMRKRGSRWRKRTVTFVVRHMHGLGDFLKRNKLIHKHISDRNTTFSHQTESSSSLSGLPSSSKWKSIVMLASESCAEAKFVTDRVGMPIALSTEKKKTYHWGLIQP